MALKAQKVRMNTKNCDKIVVRLSNNVWKKFINPKSKGTLNKMRIPGPEYIHLIVFTIYFSVFSFWCLISIKRDKLRKMA